ncbi:MAG: hypothetical protein VB068_03435, partial [Petrimonas sp.]|nr:hypothetical protein [Petrimonas sp.]
TEQVASFLHRLVSDEKKEVANLQRGMKDKGLWGQLGTRTTAAFMGIGGAAIGIAAGTVDMVDFSLDIQIANTPLLKNTGVGQKSQKRVEEKVKTTIMTAKKIVNYATTEDPKAMAQTAFKATTNYLDKTFIEGELNYTADFSGKAFGVAVSAATLSKAAAVTKAAKYDNVRVNVAKSQIERITSGYAKASQSWSAAAEEGENLTSQVLLNKVKGKLGEDVIRARLNNSKNLELVGEQIRIRTPGAGDFRIVDFLVASKRTGRLSIIEVKTGNAKRNAYQLLKDMLIADPQAPTTFFGKNARAKGFPDGMPTGAIRTFEVNAGKVRR